jgi:hypothetical protein
MWQKKDDGVRYVDYYEDRNYLSLAACPDNYSDWRLPSFSELQLLVDQRVRLLRVFIKYLIILSDFAF